MTNAQALSRIEAKARSLGVTVETLSQELRHTVETLAQELSHFHSEDTLAPEWHQHEDMPVVFTAFEGMWEGGTRHVF